MVGVLFQTVDRQLLVSSHGGEQRSSELLWLLEATNTIHEDSTLTASSLVTLLITLPRLPPFHTITLWGSGFNMNFRETQPIIGKKMLISSGNRVYPPPVRFL